MSTTNIPGVDQLVQSIDITRVANEAQIYLGSVDGYAFLNSLSDALEENADTVTEAAQVLAAWTDNPVTITRFEYDGKKAADATISCKNVPLVVSEEGDTVTIRPDNGNWWRFTNRFNMNILKSTILP